MKIFPVQEFFNRIAENYDSRYTPEKPLHHWYFNDRLRLATEGLQLNEKRVLDIGAGTGALYSYLMARYDGHIDYQGCDISSEMLASSPIPEDRRFVGTCHEIPPSKDALDVIFVLGVTTYMSYDDLVALISWCRRHISDVGTVVITFSTKSTYNTIAMKPIMPLVRLVGKRDRVAAQEFPRSTYSPDDVTDVLGNMFSVRTCHFLNQTFFPFNHLVPRTSIVLAKFLRDNINNTSILAKLSGEFMMHLTPK